MKRFLIAVCCMFFCIASKAQPIKYSFTYFHDAYTELTNDTLLNNGQMWSNEFYNWHVPFGFNFTLYGDTLTGMYLQSPTTLANDSVTINNGLILGIFDMICPMYDPIYDRAVSFLIHHPWLWGDTTLSLSPVSYKTEGQAPNRIAKIQWKNIGLMNDTTGNMYVNMQLWLYESTNVIEMRYGPSYTPDMWVFNNYKGPIVWLFYQSGYNEPVGIAECLKDTAIAPIAYTYNLDTLQPSQFHTLQGMPDSGMVYRFTPYSDTVVTGVRTVAKNPQINLAPNPVVNSLTINADEALQHVVITNSVGECVYSSTGSSNKNLKIDMSALPAGVYLVQVNDKAVKKVVKQ